MDDNVWGVGGPEGPADGPSGPIDLGEPSYGRGLSVSDAYHPSVVLRAGLQLAKEAPALFVVAGAAIWVTEVAATIPSLAATVMVSVYRPGEPFEFDLDIALGLFFLSMMARVFGWHFTGGAQVAFAHYIRTDEVRLGAVFFSLWAGISRIAYELAKWLLVGVGAVVCGFGATVFLCCCGSFAQDGIGAVIMVLVAMSIYLGGVVYLLTGFQIGHYSASIDGDPVTALGHSWASARGARLMLIALDVLWLVAFGGFAMFEAIAQTGFGPVGAVVAATGLGLPKVFATALWVGGMTAAFMLHSRDARAVAKWAFFQRERSGTSSSEG